MVSVTASERLSVSTDRVDGVDLEATAGHLDPNSARRQKPLHPERIVETETPTS